MSERSSIMLGAPSTLETERLSLRRFCPADRERYVAIRSHPEVAALLGHGVEQAEAKADWFLERCEKNWTEHGAGPWAVTWRESGELIGHAGFWYLEGFAAIGLIYGYDRRFWGLGIATEAAKAIVESDAARKLDRLTALVVPENLGSQRVLEKVGFRAIGEADHHGTRVIVFEKNRPTRA